MVATTYKCILFPRDMRINWRWLFFGFKMVLWNLLLWYLLRLNTLRDIRYQIRFFTLKRYIEHIVFFIWESSQGGRRLNATQAANYFNISSSYPVTLLSFQLDVCMCWHLQDNLVEPPNELQECLQNREEIYIIYSLMYRTLDWVVQSSSSWGNRVVFLGKTLSYKSVNILQESWGVCTVWSLGRGVPLGHWNPS